MSPEMGFIQVERENRDNIKLVTVNLSNEKQFAIRKLDQEIFKLLGGEDDYEPIYDARFIVAENVVGEDVMYVYSVFENLKHSNVAEILRKQGLCQKLRCAGMIERHLLVKGNYSRAIHGFSESLARAGLLSETASELYKKQILEPCFEEHFEIE